MHKRVAVLVAVAFFGILTAMLGANGVQQAFAAVPRAEEFVWVGNPYAQFTEDEYVHVSGDYAIFMFSKFHADWDIEMAHQAAREIKARNPNIKVFAYYSARYWFTQYSFHQSEFKEEWYLHDSFGDRIKQYHDGTGGYYIDPNNAEYRSFAIDIIEEWLSLPFDAVKPLYDGVVFDSAPPYASYFDKRLEQSFNLDKLNEGLGLLLSETRQRIGTKLMICNGLKMVRGFDFLQYTDGIVNEAFGFDRFSNGLSSKDSVLRDIAFMQDPQSARVEMLEKANITMNPPRDITVQERGQFQRFCFGSFLLGHRPGGTFFKYAETGAQGQEKIYSVWGELTNVEGIDLKPAETNLEFGNPRDRYRNEGLAFKREFDKGTVYVNMEDTPQTVTLTESLVLMEGDVAATSYKRGSVLDVPAKDALFLTIPAGAPSISHIPDQVTDEDVPAGPLAFTVGDQQTPTDLTLQGDSDNPTLVPQGNIKFGGSGSNRTVTVRPALNQYGSASITVAVTDAGGNSASDTFTLTVNPVNDPPYISEIPDQVTDEDTSTSPIPFVISDPESPADTLTITFASSDTLLVPLHNYEIAGSGSNRTLIVHPRPDRYGSTTITLTVSDKQLSSVTSFVLTVNPVNDAPTISTIADQRTNEDTLTFIPFSIDDIETLPTSLKVSATSSNPVLVPEGSLTFRGAGRNKELRVIPALDQYGSTTIKITVDDGDPIGALTAATSFVLTVDPVDDPPTMARLPNKGTREDTPVTVTVTVDDVDSPVADITISATTDNPILISSGTGYGGAGASRTITLTPLPNQTGVANVTIVASSGSLTCSRTFVLTVVAVNDAPTVSAIANKTTLEDTPITVPFTIRDVDSPTRELVVTAVSSNAAVVPNNTSNIILGGSGASRTVTLKPVADHNGDTTITIRTSDGFLIGQSSFVLTVTPVNDVPTISQVVDQVTDEDVPVLVRFTVGDAETAAGDLLVTAISSNQVLVPSSSIVAGGTGASRSVRITPASGLFGTADITLRVSDGDKVRTTTFKLTVNSVEDVPVAVPGSLTTREDTPKKGILQAADGDNDPLTFVIDANPLKGTVAILDKSTGEFRYTPNPDFNGADYFTFKAYDGKAYSSSARVSITITPVQDAPVAQDKAVTVREDNSAGIDIILKATDADGNPLTYELVSLPLHGTAKFTPPDIVKYIPKPNYYGPDSFTFKANDSFQDSNFATVAITVDGVNDPPVAEAGADKTVAAGAVVTLDGSKSKDIDDGIYTYLWTQVGGPAVQLSHADSLKATFTAPEATRWNDKVMTFGLTVTDHAGAKSYDTCKVTVPASG